MKNRGEITLQIKLYKNYFLIFLLFSLVFSCKSKQRQKFKSNPEDSQALLGSIQLAKIDPNKMKVEARLNSISLYQDNFPKLQVEGSEQDFFIIYTACFKNNCQAKQSFVGFFVTQSSIVPLSEAGNWLIKIEACIRKDISTSSKDECRASGEFNFKMQKNLQQQL